MSKICIDCGKPVTGHSHAIRCRSCGARYGYFNKHGRPPERVIEKCFVCGLEFTDYASNRKKGTPRERFCSNECRAAYTAISNSVRLGGDGLRKTKSDKDKLYYRKTAEKIRKGASAYYWKNRDAILSRKKRLDREAKESVVSAYGGKCECCGETIIEFLTIDHINGDGFLHRRRVGKGRKIYRDLIKAGFPKDNYRLLCFNCNIARGFYGYCPHHPEDKQILSHVPLNPGRKRTVK